MNLASNLLLGMLLVAVQPLLASSHQPDVSKEKDTSARRLEEVVIIGSRLNTRLAPEKMPYPIMLFNQELIKKSASVGLRELLDEEGGMFVSGNPGSLEGSGVQVMGMESEYIQILEDGQPMLGREGGVLNLERIPSFSVKRVEVMKGAMSVSFGDNALAGAINIVTVPEDKTIPLEAELVTNSQGRYDLNVGTNIKLNAKNRFSFSVGGRLFSGYDHTPNSIGNTIDPYHQANARLHWIFQPNARHTLRLVSRVSYNNIEGPYQLERLVYSNRSSQMDYMNNIEWKFSIIPKTLDIKTNFVFANYKSNNSLSSSAAIAHNSSSSYQEIFATRSFTLLRWFNLRQKGIFSAGVDVEAQKLNSDRYKEQHQVFNGAINMQQEWSNDVWTLTAGVRLDVPQGYNPNFTPKIGAQYSVRKWSFNASLGSGYRAPNFVERFLFFQNSAVGYFVVGNEGIEQVLKTLGVAEIDPKVYQRVPLRPETSIALQLGIRFQISPSQNIQVWAYRNELYDFIQTYRLPYKTSNSQNINSYRNIEKLYTQGVDVQYQLNIKNISIRANYGFLQAREAEVEREIEKGNVFGKDANGVTYRIRKEDYIGLFQRPQHTLSLAFKMSIPKYVDIHLNVKFQDGMGWDDTNRSTYFDDKSELAPALHLVNLSVQRVFPIKKMADLTVQLGVKNIFDQHVESYLPLINGCNYFIKFFISLN